MFRCDQLPKSQQGWKSSNLLQEAIPQNRGHDREASSPSLSNLNFQVVTVIHIKGIKENISEIKLGIFILKRATDNSGNSYQ